MAKPHTRWEFSPRGRNAKAICERIEALIGELRLAEQSLITATVRQTIKTDTKAKE
jgi:hypothetical protein